MPFFQGATNVNASGGIFNDVTGNQVNHYNGSHSFQNSHGNTFTTTNTNSNNDSSVRNNINYGGNQTVTGYPDWSHPAVQPQTPPVRLPAPNPTPSPPVNPPTNPQSPVSIPEQAPQPPPPSHTPHTPHAHHIPQTPHVVTPTTPAPVAHETPISHPPTTQTPVAPAPQPSSPPSRRRRSPKRKNSSSSSSSSSPSSSGSDKIDNAIAVSDFVLRTLQGASQVAPVPFLSMASALVLSIVKSAELARGNKGDFNRLATDACDLVYVVLNIYKAQESEGAALNDLEIHLKKLVSTLTKIDEFGKKKAKRHGLKRFFMSSSDAKKAQEYRERLNQALNIFWLQSSIQVRQQLSLVAERQGATLKHSLNASTSSTNHEVPVLTGRDILTALSGVDFSHNGWMNTNAGGNYTIMNTYNS